MQIRKLSTAPSEREIMDQDLDDLEDRRIMEEILQDLKNATPMFRQFAKLPNDVKQLFWHFLAQHPQIIRPECWPPFTKVALDRYDGKDDKQILPFVPAVLQICSRSRRVGLRYYYKQYFPNNSHHAMYLNPMADTLRFEDRIAMRNFYLRIDMSAIDIQTIELRYPTFSNDRQLEINLPRELVEFPKLQHVYFLVDARTKETTSKRQLTDQVKEAWEPHLKTFVRWNGVQKPPQEPTFHFFTLEDGKRKEI
ncbi:hypothetical protein LZ554_008564 [Drepanopeziza brunnea f. sp. 'monogermtubi']|nr:hypothetical protein LZ554_008564 [Drepanopeziza brunnea f. sp. 'monogermtubi']